MLKALEIEGLFNHLKSYIPLSPQLTVITGLNDSGKSSIFHAARWFIANKPKGGKFLLKTERQEVKQGCIRFFIDDYVIEKIRDSQGRTKYKINNEEFHKSELPEEILNILNINSEYNFSNNSFELNFSFQLDAPFLISEASSIGALILGELSGTAPVDKTAKHFENEVFQIRLKLRNATSQFDESLEKIKNFDGIEEKIIIFENKLEKIEIIKNRQKFVDDLVKFRMHLATADFNIEDSNERIGKTNKILRFKDSINRLIENNSRLNDLEDFAIGLKNAEGMLTYYRDHFNKKTKEIAFILPRITELREMSQRYKNLNEISEQIMTQDTVVTKHLDRLKKLEQLDVLNSKMKIIGELQEKFTKFSKFFDDLENENLLIQLGQEKIKKYDEIIQHVNFELSEIRKDITICPLCGTVLKQGKKNEG